jgi:hypothetical protein
MTKNMTDILYTRVCYQASFNHSHHFTTHIYPSHYQAPFNHYHHFTHHSITLTTLPTIQSLSPLYPPFNHSHHFTHHSITLTTLPTFNHTPPCKQIQILPLQNSVFRFPTPVTSYYHTFSLRASSPNTM